MATVNTILGIDESDVAVSNLKMYDTTKYVVVSTPERNNDGHEALIQRIDGPTKVRQGYYPKTYAGIASINHSTRSTFQLETVVDGNLERTVEIPIVTSFTLPETNGPDADDLLAAIMNHVSFLLRDVDTGAIDDAFIDGLKFGVTNADPSNATRS